MPYHHLTNLVGEVGKIARIGQNQLWQKYMHSLHRLLTTISKQHENYFSGMVSAIVKNNPRDSLVFCIPLPGALLQI